LSAQDNEMLPPSVGEGGVELWAVCGRKVISAQQKKRASAKNDRQQKEFDILAKRHLKDLRQDAHIEYR
jgi:peptidyl-prolyl cis-trans isomerase SurA